MKNFKAAARSLLKTPVPTLVVIATLAIAIGANTAIFSVVDGVLFRPLGYGDDSKLVVLWTVAEIISHSWMDATCSSTSAGKRIF